MATISKKMKRALWILAAVAISTAGYFTIRFGLRPKPIPVMNATSFENAEQIGAVIYKRLYQDVRSERVLILGSDPELQNGAEVWEGFLKSLVADGLKPDLIYTFEPTELNAPQLPEKVRKEIAAGHLVILHAPSDRASHLFEESVAKKLDQAAGHPVLALSTVNLSLDPAAIQNLQTQCLVPGTPDEGLKHLDCAKAKVSAMLTKKMRSAPTKIWSAIERHGLKEYLVFIHR